MDEHVSEHMPSVSSLSVFRAASLLSLFGMDLFFSFLLLPVSTSLCSLPRIQKAFCCVDVVAMCAGVFTCLQPPLRESVCETESRRQVVDVHTAQQNILI